MKPTLPAFLRVALKRTSLVALTILLCLAATPLAAAEPGPLGRWIFDRAHVAEQTVKAVAGPLDATILGTLAFDADPEAMYLDGTSVRMMLTDDVKSAPLPKQEITTEAWVAVEKPRNWAGLLSVVQDNGNFEKGWCLGYQESNFFFALSSVGADDGDGAITYLLSKTPFTPGVWYHVVGTYDGKQMKVYINGKLETTSTDQSGWINYPSRTWYEIGAYHDDDELYPMQGSLLEVSIYDRVLPPDEILARFNRRAHLFPKPGALKTGPLVQHLAPDRVVISWETDLPQTSTVEYRYAGSPTQRVKENTPQTAHAVTLSQLSPGPEYSFRIRWRDQAGVERGTGLYRFDASCDLMDASPPDVRSPYGEGPESGMFAEAAQAIVDQSGVDRGYCLVLGCPTGRLALELARRTNLQIIGVEPDAANVDAARRALDKAGLYGRRVVVHQGPLEKLPYAGCSANLITSEQTLISGELPPSAAEVCRVLRPCGGVAWFGQPQSSAMLSASTLKAWTEQAPLAGWKIEHRERLSAMLRRGPMGGAGQWTHLYADSGNSACSRDQLRGPMDLQWFGRPGPRQMVDRHHRSMAPLAKDGRLFIPGNNRLKAVDAYNGTPLWDLTIPNSRRVAMPRDAGHLVLSDDLVYVAVEGACRAIDVATGQCVHTFEVPGASDESTRHWGYLASNGELLFGSTTRPGASHRAHSRQVPAHYAYYDNVPSVTSDGLFCLDRHSGRELWTYRRSSGSAILNSAIAVGDGHVYFIESRHPTAVADPLGRVPLSVALAEGSSHLVALDEQTGRVVWERPVELSAVRHALYLSYARAVLLITGVYNEGRHPRYDLLAFHARRGSPRWTNHYVRHDKPAGGDHGEQDQHPAIVGNVVYSRPAAFDLTTGKRLDFNLDRSGHGCGTLSASASYLFGRGGNPQMYPLAAAGRGSAPLTTVTRPGCWINMIPAAGLLLLPESSSGCSCPFAIQTSIGFAPQTPKF